MLHKRSERRVIVFVDFDGTAAQEIASKKLLERFAQGDWQKLDHLLDEGKISFKECVERQFGMLKATRDEITGFARRELKLRASFKEFVEYCGEKHYEVKIVSESLDVMTKAILEREGLQDLEIYCDHAIFNDRNFVRVEFPHFRADCACGVGNCKRAHLRTHRARFDFIIYIGDGSNDLCPAKEADLIFARRRLAEHCRAQNIHYFPFEDFHTVIRTFKQLKL